jgi:ubiquinone/menaquinone biosynthesis C-methylase UbiE
MHVSVMEGYRLWADSYETSPNPLLALENRLLQEMFRAVPSKCVVDVACGTGRWAAWFAGRGASVVGIDLCPEMLARGPANLHGRLALGRAETLPVSANTADLTVCSFAVGYFPDLQQAISEMARITKSGGRLVIDDLHPAAVAAGWTRSFRAGDCVYEMEHYLHSLDDLSTAARRAGLHLDSESHGYFGELERRVFETAGKAERFAQVTDVPAVWIGIWRKA